ncbi:MAG TPA: TraB/GumN family protein [Gemmatimonadaceae bacterium]|jgi:uncharacterized protein YbaP (TraB family)|nr:TraB/GumN family protein [Gemmatimonadaceae bacterium]
MTTTLKLALTTGALVAGVQPSQAQVRATAIGTHGPAVTSSKHMLYRVHGPNGATVYILGSVHLLSADAATLPAEVDSAFAHSRSLTLETSLDSAMARGPEMLMRGRYSDGKTLRGVLSPQSATKVDSLLHLYGLSLDQVNGFKPWMVSLLMTQLAMQKLNFQAQYGVDMQLNTRAKQASKPVLGLESVDFQMGLFDGLSQADQERMLVESDGPDVTAKEMGSIRDAWSRGDASMLDSLINSNIAKAPTMFDALITARNRAWIPKIESLIKGNDDALVVVGAGHLVGEQGVVAMLRSKGYTIDQM